MWPGSAYNHRKRWPAFARAWDEMIETGYVRLEAALIEAGADLFSPRGIPPDNPIREMTAEQALQLLNMHRHEVRGIGGVPGRQASPAKRIEDVRQRLEKVMRGLGLIGPED
jgi:hypothetical protein